MRIMIQNKLIGLVCPYCGLLFFTRAGAVMFACPECSRRWKVAPSEMLEACLGDA